MCVSLASVIQAASGLIAARRQNFWQHNTNSLFLTKVASRQGRAQKFLEGVARHLFVEIGER